MAAFPSGRATAWIIAMVAVAVVLSACAASPNAASKPPPTPVMIVLEDRNRMVWLSRLDDDQPVASRTLWNAVSRMRPVTASTVPTPAAVSLQMTGRSAQVSIDGSASLPGASGITTYLLVTAPGTSGLARGDVLARFGGAVYRRVGSVPDDALAPADDLLLRRMGLR